MSANNPSSQRLQNYSQTLFYCLFLLWLFLSLPVIINAQTTKLYLSRQYPVKRVENNLWIGLPSAIYQFHREDNAFKKYSVPQAENFTNVNQFYYHDEWLWSIGRKGLAGLHLRLNEWYYFDNSRGLPSDSVNAIDFEEDYIWVATRNGAARFDLLIEEWEIFDQSRGLSLKNVRDILVLDDQVWMTGDNQLLEYNPEFEKWRYYQVGSDSSVKTLRLFRSGEDIWIVTNQGLARFQSTLQSFQYYFSESFDSRNLSEIILEDNTIWAVTKTGLFTFDESGEVWKAFEGSYYLQEVEITDIAVTSKFIWILSGDKVHRWEREPKSWKVFDYATGLSGESYRAIYAEGESVFLFSPDQIEYRLTEQESWSRRKLTTERGGFSRGRKLLGNLFDNQSGGYVQTGKYRWRLEGSRAVFLQERRSEMGNGNATQTTSGERLDLKSQLALTPERNISAYYNDSDFSEVMYGVRYRSRTNDVLQEFNWGDFRNLKGGDPFAETPNLFGSQVWLQAGGKTSRFKRSLVTLKAFSGEKRSQKTYENYTGAAREFQQEIRDIQFLKKQFYSLPAADSLAGVPEIIELLVDDQIASNNDPNTRIHHSVAGITGDFDVWIPTEDYYFYPRFYALRLLKTVPLNATIAVRYRQGDRVHSEILQYREDVSTALQNVYYLGGQNILPWSLEIEISDSTGVLQSLQAYGLDENTDGRVDANWIDYNSGLLIFPRKQPFPAVVYDPAFPESLFKIEVRLQTELGMIQLNRNNLVRGSETITLDGLPLTGGNDYIVDYTAGALIFVRDGLINADSRIEIEYEYYSDDHNPVHGASLNISPSDNFYLQGNWSHFTAPGKNGADSITTQLLTVNGELRRQLLEMDLRMIPAVALQDGDVSKSSKSFEALLSSSRLRFQSLYKTFSRDYLNLYHPGSVVGKIEEMLRFYGSADLTTFFRLTGEWQNIEGFNATGSRPSDRRSSLTSLFHKTNWPAWQVNYSQFQTDSSRGIRTGKSHWEHRMDYQLPASVGKTLHISGLKFEGYYRSGEIEETTDEESSADKVEQKYLRFTPVFSDRFQAGFFYRVRSTSRKEDNQRLSQSDRMTFDLAHEAWQLLQVNIRMENHLNRDFIPGTSGKSVNLRQFSQLNLRFFPGQISRKLRSLSFDITYDRTVNGMDTYRHSTKNWLWWTGESDLKKLNHSTRLENWFLQNEFRPNAWLLLYSFLEYSPRRIILGKNETELRTWRWNEKGEFRLSSSTWLTLQYRQYYQNSDFGRTDRYYEPSTQVEHRFSRSLLGIGNLIYRYRESEQGKLRNISDRYEARLETVWNRQAFLKMRRLELRQSLSGYYLVQSGFTPYNQLQWSGSISLDLYPVHAVVVRLRGDWTDFTDLMNSRNDTRTLFLSLKLAVRF